MSGGPNLSTMVGNNLNTLASPIDALTGANAANMLGLQSSSNVGLLGPGVLGSELGLNGSSPSSQTNYDGGMPTMPGYVSETTGPAYTAEKGMALNPGQSPWATAATNQQTKLMNNQIDSGNQAVAGETAGADANLASTGGLSSGARERVAEGGAKNLMSMTQSANQNSANNTMQIGTNDAQNKMQMMGQVAGAEEKNQSDLNSYTQNVYNTQMSTWAANKMANATANSGKGGGGGGK